MSISEEASTSGEFDAIFRLPPGTTYDEIFGLKGPRFEAVLNGHYTKEDCVLLTRHLVERLGFDPRIFASSVNDKILVIPKIAIYARATYYDTALGLILYDNGLYPEVYTRMQTKWLLYYPETFDETGVKFMPWPDTWAIDE